MPRKQSRLSRIDAKGVPRIDAGRSRPAWGIQIAGCGFIAWSEPARRIQALIPGPRAQSRAARSGRRRAEVAGLLSRVFGSMLGGKRAGVESCTSICVQLLEAGFVRAWGMSCICGGIASIGRPDADVGRLARGRSAVAHALKNVRRDCRGKPARQLPARPYVVAVDEGWAAGFVCRRVITGAGGNDVHGGIVDQPCIGDRILTPRGCLGRPGVYRTEALGIAHELQSFICDGAAAAGRPGAWLPASAS